MGVFRAADWNLQEPQWTGRMRLVAKGEELLMKLEDKASGELFAKCPIDKYPGVALESVTDSSRYFVVKIQDDNGEQSGKDGVSFSNIQLIYYLLVLFCIMSWYMIVDTLHFHNKTKTLYVFCNLPMKLIHNWLDWCFYCTNMHSH